jgi:hypothetical protein
MDIELDRERCDSTVLCVTFSHDLPRPLPYCVELMPWIDRDWMRIRIERAGSQAGTIEQYYILADRFILTYDTLPPHHEISGRICLDEFCPDIGVARKADSLVLRWTYTFKAADFSLKRKLRGTVGIPRQNSPCP